MTNAIEQLRQARQTRSMWQAEFSRLVGEQGSATTGRDGRANAKRIAHAQTRIAEYDELIRGIEQRISGDRGSRYEGESHPFDQQDPSPWANVTDVAETIERIAATAGEVLGVVRDVRDAIADQDARETPSIEVPNLSPVTPLDAQQIGELSFVAGALGGLSDAEASVINGALHLAGAAGATGEPDDIHKIIATAIRAIRDFELVDAEIADGDEPEQPGPERRQAAEDIREIVAQRDERTAERNDARARAQELEQDLAYSRTELAKLRDEHITLARTAEAWRVELIRVIGKTNGRPTTDETGITSVQRIEYGYRTAWGSEHWPVEHGTDGTWIPAVPTGDCRGVFLNAFVVYDTTTAADLEKWLDGRAQVIARVINTTTSPTFVPDTTTEGKAE